MKTSRSSLVAIGFATACAPDPVPPAPVPNTSDSSPIASVTATALPPAAMQSSSVSAAPRTAPSDCAKHSKPYPEVADSSPGKKSPPADGPMMVPLQSTAPSRSHSGSVGTAGRVVASMAPEFRRCFQSGLACDAEMKGTVRITSRVDSEGRVRSAQATYASGLSQGVIDCVAEVVSSKTFDKPEGAGATIVIPVSFFPQQ
jgi:hypothetical protein